MQIAKRRRRMTMMWPLALPRHGCVSVIPWKRSGFFMGLETWLKQGCQHMFLLVRHCSEAGDGKQPDSYHSCQQHCSPGSFVFQFCSRRVRGAVTYGENNSSTRFHLHARQLKSFVTNSSGQWMKTRVKYDEANDTNTLGASPLLAGHLPIPGCSFLLLQSSRK